MSTQVEPPLAEPPLAEPPLAEKEQTVQAIAGDIEREKIEHEKAQLLNKSVLEDLNEIFQKMFIWYIDNITYEYIFTDEKNRKERYEKKEVEKKGKIKYVRTNTKKSFDTNLEELETDVMNMVDMFENKSGLFSLVEYDDTWYTRDPLKRT